MSAPTPPRAGLAAPVLARIGPDVARLSAGTVRPGLLLDRDGVVIEDTGYLRDPAEVRLMPGAAAGIAAARRLGAAVVVVSNQSGVGRGFYGWPDVAAVDDRMADLLAMEGARLDAALYAGSAPGRGCPYRKPAAGLPLLAARLCSIDLAASVLIGDRASDIGAAKAAGVGAAILIGADAVPGPVLPAGGTAEAFALALEHLGGSAGVAA